MFKCLKCQSKDDLIPMENDYYHCMECGWTTTQEGYEHLQEIKGIYNKWENEHIIKKEKDETNN